jgi:hypothetical protein
MIYWHHSPRKTGPYATYPEYSRANSYPWSPISRRARPRAGPHSLYQVLTDRYLSGERGPGAVHPRERGEREADALARGPRR